MEEDIKDYEFCSINGREMKVYNWKIGPPGLFMGRGKNPKNGHIKVFFVLIYYQRLLPLSMEYTF